MSDPHDTLFHSTFGTPEHATELLRGWLPAALVAHIDWNTLTPKPRSYRQAAQAWRHTDLLFSVNVGDRPSLYLLIEHQSTPDKCMPFRMLRYMTRIWDDYLQAHPKADRLPAILSFVVSHCTRPWRAPTRLHDLVALPSNVRHPTVELVPGLHFLLDDLTACDEDDLVRRKINAQAKLTMLALRHVRLSRHFASALLRWAPLLRSVEARPQGLEPLIALFSYIFEVGEDPAQQLIQVLQSILGKATTEAVMTTAEQLREEGRQATLTATLVRLMERKFVSLPEDTHRRIQHASIFELEQWLDRVLTADRIEDVLGA